MPGMASHLAAQARVDPGPGAYLTTKRRSCERLCSCSLERQAYPPSIALRIHLFVVPFPYRTILPVMLRFDAMARDSFPRQVSLLQLAPHMMTFLEYSYLHSTLLIYVPSQTILLSAREDPLIVCAVRTSHAPMSAAPVDCSPWKDSSCVKSLPGVPSLRHTLPFTSRSFTPSKFVM